MAMTFIGALNVAEAGEGDARKVLVAALGCNIAWGLADAVMYVVGTLTQREEFAAARDAGAVFGVSPGLTPSLIDAAKSSGLPLLPGVMSPSEVMAAREAGFRHLKLFPAVPAGGIGMLNAIAGPLPDVTFCPTGGISMRSSTVNGSALRASRPRSRC